MRSDDRTSKFVLIWIAVMLTILAIDKLVHIPVAIAQEPGTSSSKIELRGPIEVVIKEPVKTDIQGWNAYPSQAIRVKIDDPWPAKIRIDDEVQVKGELHLRD
ncbi:MAG: hypothetical protein JSW02_07405 [candidate division WOR-3 bacterium]|nr:MAG: hypothetical protein JSW02_07405 [candidate division WOR-3 bacterium]